MVYEVLVTEDPLDPTQPSEEQRHVQRLSRKLASYLRRQACCPPASLPWMASITRRYERRAAIYLLRPNVVVVTDLQYRLGTPESEQAYMATLGVVVMAHQAAGVRKTSSELLKRFPKMYIPTTARSYWRRWQLEWADLLGDNWAQRDEDVYFRRASYVRRHPQPLR